MSMMRLCLSKLLCHAALFTCAAVSTPAAAQESKLIRGASKSALQKMTSRLEQHLKREHAREFAEVQAIGKQIQGIVEPRQRDLLQKLESDRRGPAFLRDLDAVARQHSAANSVAAQRAAISAQVSVYNRHNDLLRDLRQDSDTDGLREELARALGVRPGDLGGDGGTVVYDDRAPGGKDKLAQLPDRSSPTSRSWRPTPRP